MKEKQTDRCPGCGKHCSAKNPGCGYGRKYFKQQDAGAPKHLTVDAYYESLVGSAKEKKTKPPKWEAYVRRGSLAWQLLSAGRTAKRALHQESWNEEEFFAALSEQEQHMLAQLLKKILLRQGIAE